MTGFGEASATEGGIRYFVEVRSLNSKYFKATIRLPEEFQGLEAELESLLRSALHRGTVTMTAKCTEVGESAALSINHQALERYIEQIRQAPMVASGQVSIDVASLLSLPGVLQAPANEEARMARTRAALGPLTRRACEGVLAMRGAEGRALLEDLSGQRALIAERLAAIARRAPGVVAEYESRLKSRIESLIQGTDARLSTVDVVREIAVYAERTDIAEEISRLGGHIEQFGELLGAPVDKPVGRTMDFLAQEMLREANTIASKSPDAEISRAIVDVKGAIDRIKEQVQNVE
ncbi:MAG: YicC family protein [Phycisphaerales bacterium]|nr:YicC family protein [Phycisphaerales bacterium]